MTATLRQQEIEVVCLKIKCYLEGIDHLRCFFVVINENKPALIIGSQLNPFFCDDELVQMGRLRSAAQLNTCLQFLSEFPRSCFSWQDPLREEKKRKVAAINLWIFLKPSTWARDFLMFFIAYFIFPKSNSSVKIIFLLRWQRWLLSFEEC